MWTFRQCMRSSNGVILAPVSPLVLSVPMVVVSGVFGRRLRVVGVYLQREESGCASSLFRETVVVGMFCARVCWSRLRWVLLCAVAWLVVRVFCSFCGWVGLSGSANIGSGVDWR